MLDRDGWADIVGRAGRAPSIHNTQPWLFTAIEDRLEVHRDTSRALPAVDPSGRQQVVSIGTAVLFASVAAAARGYRTAVDVLPDDARPEHLATLRVTGEQQATEQDRALDDAIDRRHTDRSPFSPDPVPADVLEQIQVVTAREGVWVKQISREDEESTATFLVSQAEELEQRDPAYLAELQAWTRTDQTAPDGIPIDALPEGDRNQRASNWLIRDFLAGRGRPPRAGLPPQLDDPPPPVERPAVLLMGTVIDGPGGWVHSGLALGRLLLTATVSGLAASPLTQALDQSWARTRLSHRLHLVGYPQMLLRLGYPTGEVAHSGRRPVADVLRFSPDPPSSSGDQLS